MRLRRQISRTILVLRAILRVAHLILNSCFFCFFIFFSRFFLKTFELQYVNHFNISLDNVQSRSRSRLSDDAISRERHWWRCWTSRQKCRLIASIVFHDRFSCALTSQNAQFQFDYSYSRVRSHFSSLFLHSQWSQSRCSRRQRYKHKTTMKKRVE